jgi:hypothetical protein
MREEREIQQSLSGLYEYLERRSQPTLYYVKK